MLVEAGDHIHLVWSTVVDPEQPPLHVAIDPYDMNAEANFHGPAFVLDPLADGSGLLRTTLEGWDLFDAMSMQAEPVLVEGLFLILSRARRGDRWSSTLGVCSGTRSTWKTCTPWTDAALDEALIMLDDCGDREDVARVIREMIAELNVGHAYYLSGGWSMFDRGGQEPAPDAVGFMGVDWIYENEHWTVESVVQPEPGFQRSTTP